MVSTHTANRLRHGRHQVSRGAKAGVKLALMYSPRGFARLVAMFSKWAYDWDTARQRHEWAGKLDTAEAVKAHNMRRHNLKARMLVISAIGMPLAFPILAWISPTSLGIICGVTLALWITQLIPGKHWGEYVAAAVIGAYVMWQLPQYADEIPVPPWWVFAILGAAVLVGLGYLGKDSNRPVLKSNVMPPHVVPPLRAPMVTAALVTLGHTKMSQKTEDDPVTPPNGRIRLLMDVARQGPGYQLDLEVPAGVTAAFVQKKREAFAGALRRELGCVWPAVGARHPDHLSLYVCDQPMSRAAQDPWPLLESGGIDLGAKLPMFTNQRAEWVSIRLAYANMIIGAVPRMGKTFVLRQCLLAAGLDRRAKVYAYDGKGMGDLGACALFAHSYVRGARIDRPELIEQVRADVRELRTEMGRRADIIDALPPEECPENKVTSALIDARPDLRLGWIVVGMDETQMYFAYGDDDNREHKRIRSELKAGVTELVKLGPALGIIVILATQQVNNDTIPTSIANNAVLRFCLKIEGHEPNDRILGTGAYKKGIDAQMFDFEEDKSIGYLKGDGARAQIVRSVFGLDGKVAEEVGMRARRLREAAGLLTGHAAGEKVEVFDPDLLADVRDVMDHPPVTRMHLTQIVDALGLLRPKTWGNLDVDALGTMLREAGVPTPQVKVGRRNTTGVKREDLDPPEIIDEIVEDEAVG